MTREKPIHYEPHPVSPERKAELIAQGVRIVDAAYKPAESAPDEAVSATPAKRRGRTAAPQTGAESAPDEAAKG